MALPMAEQFFGMSVFFLNIFPFMWWRSPLSFALCWSSSSFARPLCVSWQRRANGKLLVPLLPFSFSGFFPAAVVGHASPAWLCVTAVRISVWERRRVCLPDRWCCVSGHISVCNRNRELVHCYMCKVSTILICTNIQDFYLKSLMFTKAAFV